METQKITDMLGKRVACIVENEVGNLEVFEGEVTGILLRKGEKPEIRMGKYKWCKLSAVCSSKEAADRIKNQKEKFL